jgi:hypothetical protein
MSTRGCAADHTQQTPTGNSRPIASHVSTCDHAQRSIPTSRRRPPYRDARQLGLGARQSAWRAVAVDSTAGVSRATLEGRAEAVGSEAPMHSTPVTCAARAGRGSKWVAVVIGRTVLR